MAQTPRGVFDPQFRDPRQFVKLRWQHGMEYATARRMLGADDIPVLHELLVDPAYRSDWIWVSQAIGYVSRDPNSIPILMDYLRRDEDWGAYSRPQDVLNAIGKLGTLWWIALIDGPSAEPILRRAITREGAIELVKDWIDAPEPYPLSDRREYVIERVRSDAAMGLIYTRRPEAQQAVTDLYEELNRSTDQHVLTSTLFSGVISAVAAGDAIREVGFEPYLSMGLNERHSRLKPYLDKYGKRYFDATFLKMGLPAPNTRDGVDR